MQLGHLIKKVYWFFSAKYAQIRYPIDKDCIYLGVTGTDGKTTTSSLLYEIAKRYGYNPLLITTVSIKFEDKDIEITLKSESFFAYSLKNLLKAVQKLDIKNIVKNILFLDKKGFVSTEEQHRTTPLASEIRKLLIEYKAKGADLFIIETTSHALDQYRVYSIPFDSIAYTNITNEHLDYHSTWEGYARAKAGMINQLKVGGAVSINIDDPKSYKFLTNYIKELKRDDIRINTYNVENYQKVNRESFWINRKVESENFCQVFASTKSIEATKPKDKVTSYYSGLSIFGDYNIYNALAAFSCFTGLKDITEYKTAAESLKRLKSIEGRMNFLSTNPTVIVDFAHTPNAVIKALESVQKLKGAKSRLWVIFGCAGERDHYKRPVMGKAAYDFADNILITSEDPRSENLHQINTEIISGFKTLEDDFVIHTYYEGIEYTLADKFIMRFDEPNINSRKDAIKFAINNAQKNDIIIILGKGHERSMCFFGKEYPWNDIEEVKKMLKLQK